MASKKKTNYTLYGFLYVLLHGFIYDYFNNKSESISNLVFLTLNTVIVFWLTWWISFHHVKPFIEKRYPNPETIEKRILTFISLSSWVTAVIIAVLASSIYMIEDAPLSSIKDDIPDFVFGFILTQSFLSLHVCMTFLTEWKAMTIETEQLKRENIMAQFELLKQQLNPHLLFNSLHSLKSLLRNSPRQAEEFVIKMADLLRYLLQNRSQDLIAVHEEMKMLSSYIFMLKTRFEDNLIVNVNIQSEARDKLIPILSLQLLLENAMKHNVISRENPLTIELYSQDETLVIKNQLQPKLHVSSSLGLGLGNLRKRCEHFGKELLIETNGSYFKVTLPLITQP